MDEAEYGVVAYLTFANEKSIMYLIGAVLLEANDERQFQRRYMQIEAMRRPPAIPGTSRMMMTAHVTPRLSTSLADVTPSRPG